MAARPACLAILVMSCGRIGFRATGDGDGGPGGGAGDGAITIGDGSRPDIVFAANVAFVTSQTVIPGTLGGLSAGDMVCQTAADQAALPGTYIAWLSVTGTDAITRLGGSRGWVRPDGTPVADMPADLTSGRIWSPISIAADGSDQVFSDAVVSTGTGGNGLVDANNCAQWTSTGAMVRYGLMTSVNATWTTNNTSSTACAGPSRIYCFGTGNQVMVGPPAVNGRRAFFSTPVTGGGGVSGFDAHCQADADAAALGGTFHALVATSTASAISRFDTNGPRWVRLDGVPLAPTAADLATGFRVPPDQYADGTYYAVPFGAVKAWTGATAPSALATTHACVDWTSTSSSKDGEHGQPTSAGTTAFDNGSARRCDDSSYGVYCLEL